MRLVGGITAAWALLFVTAATVAYIEANPGFSFFSTYMSDIGDSSGWPAALFNAGTLIAAPMRLLFLVLVVMALYQLGAGPLFVISTLILGVVSTIGTVLMTAVPYSEAPGIHATGIPMYFWGVVLLQGLVGLREWSLPMCPRLLAVVSYAVAGVFIVFGVLLFMQQSGRLDRSAPVVWEWLAYASSVAWVVFHCLLLGSSEDSAIDAHQT